MKRLSAGLAALLVLSGCAAFSGDSGAPPSHSDPRDGRVTITWSNCGWGNCIYDWKVCIGRDLETHLDGEVRTIKDSSECDPR